MPSSSEGQLSNWYSRPDSSARSHTHVLLWERTHTLGSYLTGTRSRPQRPTATGQVSRLRLGAPAARLGLVRWPSGSFFPGHLQLLDPAAHGGRTYPYASSFLPLLQRASSFRWPCSLSCFLSSSCCSALSRLGRPGEVLGGYPSAGTGASNAARWRCPPGIPRRLC